MTQKKEKKEMTLEPVNTTKPDKPCWICKKDKWWQRADGGWVCGVCHPDPKFEPHRVALPSDNYVA